MLSRENGRSSHTRKRSRSLTRPSLSASSSSSSSSWMSSSTRHPRDEARTRSKHSSDRNDPAATCFHPPHQGVIHSASSSEHKRARPRSHSHGRSRERDHVSSRVPSFLSSSSSSSSALQLHERSRSRGRHSRTGSSSHGRHGNSSSEHSRTSSEHGRSQGGRYDSGAPLHRRSSSNHESYSTYSKQRYPYEEHRDPQVSHREYERDRRDYDSPRRSDARWSPRSPRHRRDYSPNAQPPYASATGTWMDGTNRDRRREWELERDRERAWQRERERERELVPARGCDRSRSPDPRSSRPLHSGSGARNEPSHWQSSAHSQSYSQSYSQSQSRSQSVGERGPESEKHLHFEQGMLLSDRYVLVGTLGTGTFARVIEAWDRERGERVAIKVVRAVRRYATAARTEARHLEALNRHDPQCQAPIVRLREWFSSGEHTCLVFPRLGLSLYQFLEANQYQGFPLRHVRAFAQHVLRALLFMHDLTMIHTDLKPENILLCDPESRYVYREMNRSTPASGSRRSSSRASSGGGGSSAGGNELAADEDGRPLRLVRVPVDTEVVVIDFGNATYESDHHTSVITTRQYRAPEVLLNTGWSYGADMFSVGCILAELCTGLPLFDTRNDEEHIVYMEALLGEFPRSLVDRCTNHCRKYFDNDGRVTTQSMRRASPRGLRRMSRPLEEQFPEEYRDPWFMELLRNLLRLDARERISARDALESPFFEE